jgi:hypothetical protein
MRFIEIHVDAVLDRRHVAVLREAIERRGVKGAVRFWQSAPTTLERLRSAFARRLCQLEWRMSRVLGRKSPVEVIYKDVDADHDVLTVSNSGAPAAVVLLNSSGNLPMDVLRGTGAGVVVVKFQHARSSDVVGLAEVCFQKEIVGVTIEVWRPEDHLPSVADLKIKTLFTLSMTQEMVMRKTIAAVADCLWRLQEGLALSADFVVLPSSQAVGISVEASPKGADLAQLMVYLALMVLRTGGKALKKWRGIRAQWLVQLSRSNWRQHEPAVLRALSNPKDHYRADPFVVSHQGKTVIFVEEFANDTQLGHIAAIQVSESGGVSDLGICLKEPFHLSFPFVFKWQGQLYMCPESNHSRQIRVYRCEEFPMRWVLDTVLMDNVAACDCMLFEKDGRWWMLANLDSSGLDIDFCSELYLFWADSPLSTRWTPHPLNPVVRDGRKARNGGIILEDGRVYRVAQRHSYDVYGRSHTIYEITRLTETQYQETLVHRNTPPEGSIGAHHLSSTGEWTVSDSLMQGRS